MKCVIFRCSKKDEMYLYVPYQEQEEKLLSDLPDGLQQVTGRLEQVMELELSPERKLARANVEEVIASLEDKGFYLQMPPNELIRKDDSMLHNPSDSF
jgi:uncharacterized protein YcgL (UPF0745 family)